MNTCVNYKYYIFNIIDVSEENDVNKILFVTAGIF